jgi:carbamate kinase
MKGAAQRVAPFVIGGRDGPHVLEGVRMERVVVALGGNALLRRGADDTFEEMYRACRQAAERIADIAADGWQVVLTHGNGPQVGRILLQQEAAAESVHPMPLDVCGAESQGQIGYLLQVTIGDVFFERGMERPVATVLTLTRVRPDDPAFANPTKYVGPYYEEDEARRLEGERGYTMRADPHGGWRRVVPSPTPYSIVETPVIARLVADDVVVIASGGGGVPVVEDGPRLIGKEGVVDKDLAAAILAKEVGATTLLILTDVKKVQRGYGSLYPEDIDRMTVDEAQALLKRGEFGAGSMGPKIEAAVGFVRGGGAMAVVADLEDATDALRGEAGTVIMPRPDPNAG